MNSGSGQDNRKMKKRIAVAIVSTLLVILSLYAVNAVILGQQKTKQLEISRTLLHYSEDLSQNVALGLKSITTQGCDKTSLDSYRQIKLNNLYFGDIGFIEKGKLSVLLFGVNSRRPFHFLRNCIKRREVFSSRSFQEKTFSRAMRPFIIILLSSPPAMLTINSPRLPQAIP
jgi:hypothetical protein